MRGARKAETRPARPCSQTSVRWTMKRKVAQRETQCAYAHARSKSGSVDYEKVRRTLFLPGVPRATLPCSLQQAGHRKNARKAVKPFFAVGPIKCNWSEHGAYTYPSAAVITVLASKLLINYKSLVDDYSQNEIFSRTMRSTYRRGTRARESSGLHRLWSSFG